MNLTAESLPAALNRSTTIFDLEQNFEYATAQGWFLDNWHHSFYFIMVYLLVTFYGHHIMQARTGFGFRIPLVIWSCFCATFSIVGTSRVLPELVQSIQEHGFGFSICDSSYWQVSKVSGFWMWLFTMSKVPALMGTAFVIVRKQPLTFLHWYHHSVVLFYAWYSFGEHPSTGRWFVVMNYAMNAFVYSYIALKAMKLRIPRHIYTALALGQLVQVLIGCYINLITYQRKSRGDQQCDVTVRNIMISLSIYMSFFVLFVHLFYKACIAKKVEVELLDENIGIIAEK